MLYEAKNQPVREVKCICHSLNGDVMRLNVLLLERYVLAAYEATSVQSAFRVRVECDQKALGTHNLDLSTACLFLCLSRSLLRVDEKSQMPHCGRMVS